MCVLRYPYKPRAAVALAGIIFGGGAAYLFAHIAQTNTRALRFYHIDALTLSPENAKIFYWVMAAFCGLFVLMGFFGFLIRLVSSRELILTETALHAPPGTVLPGKSRVVPISSITRLSLWTGRRHRFLYAFHRSGKIMINESFMPGGAAFDELYAELAARIRRLRT
jgi:hypothetical protein